MTYAQLKIPCTIAQPMDCHLASNALLRPVFMRGCTKKRRSLRNALIFYSYNCGPAFTSALPASLPSYLAKFLMKRPAKSLALTSHSEASA